MKRFCLLVLSIILLFSLTVSVSAVEYDGPARTSRYCSQAPMNTERELFSVIERSGLNAALTRSMAAYILAGISGIHEGSYYSQAVTDVNPELYYASAVFWAADNNLFSLENGAFRPDQAVSREDLAYAIKQCLACTGRTLPAVNVRYQFNDGGLMNYQKREASALVQQGGVMIENGDGLFCPYETVTVTEAESIFLRLLGGMRMLFSDLPVSTVPESEPVDDSWFEDACFIGHSQVVGFKRYANIKMDYFAVEGFDAQNVLDFPYFPGHNGRDAPLKKVLSIFQYKKVYIMLGINDASDKKDRVERFMTPMRKILDLVRELQPDATIYIISLTPVGRATPNLILYNRENTIFYSQMLKDLSREYRTEYLDVFRLLCDSEGYFKEGYSGDGIHLQAKYYPLFADFLRTHTC